MHSTIPAKTAPLILRGTPNFRDIGGLPARGGLRVRHGLIYRSEGPTHLTEEDAAALRALGLAMVCDLRSAGERDAEPNDWCKGTAVELAHLDGSENLRVREHSQWRAVFERPSAETAREAMLATYRAKPAAMAPQLRRLFGRILDDRPLPMLIHCTAGKDRTGVAVAILLAALGTPREAIYADYLRSAEHGGERFIPSVEAGFAAAYGRPPDRIVVEALISADAAFLDAAFEAAGPIERYLEDELDLDSERRRRLRSLLLEAV